MSHPVEIPRHVDDPPTLLLWRIDDLVPVVLMLVFGILADQLIVFNSGFRQSADCPGDAALAE